MNTTNNLLAEYDDILSAIEAQKILKTGRSTIYKLLKSGSIRSLTIGKKYRIPKLYLLEYIYPNIYHPNLTKKESQDGPSQEKW